MDNFKILKNYILYFLFVLFICIIGLSNVFADTYTNIGYLSNKSTVQVAVTYQTGSNAPLLVNKDQTYNIPGISDIIINISNYSFNANTVYEIEFNIPYSIFNNNLNSVQVAGATNSGCTFISTRNLDGHYPRVRFSCANASNGLVITYSNTSGLNIITSTSSSQTGGSDFRWNYTYLILVDVSQDTTIIEQNNQIISQNNQIIQGQQDIIDNQNQNTQEIIDSNKICTYYDKNSIVTNGLLDYYGSIDTSFPDYGITDYIPISSNDNLTMLYSGGNAASMCFYNTNKSLIKCDYNYIYSSNSIVTIPENTSYVRFGISKSQNKPTFKLCQNGNQALNDSINNLDDTLNDDNTSGATSEASDFFESFTTDTFGLTSIITAPLNLIRSVLTSNCTTLQLPLPYLDNRYLELPCMSSIYSQYFGTFFTIYQTITYGIIAYWVCVRIFNQVKDFKNPEHDEIEVMDL